MWSCVSSFCLRSLTVDGRFLVETDQKIREGEGEGKEGEREKKPKANRDQNN